MWGDEAAGARGEAELDRVVREAHALAQLGHQTHAARAQRGRVLAPDEFDVAECCDVRTATGSRPECLL